ncbi:MAG: DUF1934 domain-containing protein [Lachnospiraceae bacterium]|nr:DUF1934 domain-containing protein [Lachnospiraceae bacterium]
MKQEVKVIISGMQGENVGNDQIQVVSVGQMYEKDNFTCVTYDEVVDEEENGVVQVVKNLIKINDEQVEVIKKGPVKSHMVFVPEQTTYTYYSTPIGELEVGVHTRSIDRSKRSNGFGLKLRYDLEMNQSFISSCSVNIAVEV